MFRGDYNWFHTNAQGRGSKDCAQADEWSEHPVLQQETRLLPQIPSGESCFFFRKIFLTRIFFFRACGLSRRSPFCIASTRRGWRRSSIFRRPVRSKSTLFRWSTVVYILKHDWFDIISKIDFQYVKNPSFPIKKHSHHLLSQTKMAIHDIVATTYYLENYDRSKINLEVTEHKICVQFF